MLKMAPMWKGIVNKMEKHGLNMYFIVLCMFYLFPPDVEGFMMRSLLLPVVPHKAVAEVSRIGNYRRDWLL